MKITIRRLQEASQHQEALCQLWKKTLGPAWGRAASELMIRDRLRKNSVSKDAFPVTFVLLADDQPIGMCSLSEWSESLQQGGLWLESLCVDPSWQGHGLGRMLIEHALKYAWIYDHDDVKLYVFYDEQRRYYESMGFQCGENQVCHGFCAKILKFGTHQSLLKVS